MQWLTDFYASDVNKRSEILPDEHVFGDFVHVHYARTKSD